MCTVAWQSDSEGYSLVFNRDELRSRSEAELPRIQKSSAGTAFVAPTDPDGGGTWIFANVNGLCVCLLNHYTAQSASSGAFRSRGQLLLELADVSSAESLEFRLNQSLSGSRYRSFRLLVLSPGAEPAAFCWNERSLEPESVVARPMMTSSSFESERIVDQRQRQFDRMKLLSADDLANYLNASEVMPTAETVRMSRPDARTVSQVCVQLQADQLEMKYFRRSDDDCFAAVPDARLSLQLDSELELV